MLVLQLRTCVLTIKRNSRGSLNMKQILAIFMLIVFSGNTFASESPDLYLEKIATKMIQAVKKNQSSLKTDKMLAIKLVKKHLLSAIDRNGFAKRTLGKKAWKSLSEAQQQKFVSLFINLVIGNYAKGLSLYDGQTFQFKKAIFSKSGKSSKVRSSMQQSGTTPVIIDYLLSNKTGSWKIINITIEGVSMNKSYKNQFLPRLNELGIDAFLADLEKNAQ